MKMAMADEEKPRCEALLVTRSPRHQRCSEPSVGKHGGYWLCFTHAAAVKDGMRTVRDVIYGRSVRSAER